MTNEYNRIVQSTSFNNIKLLDGSNLSVRIQHGFGTQESTEVGAGSIFGQAAGDGTFSLGTSIGGVDGQGMVAADFNNDGYSDFASLKSGAGGRLVVSLNNGDGTFRTSTSIVGPTTVTNSNYIVAGDLNGDGIQDLVWTDQGTAYSSLGRGDGTFDASRSIALAASQNTVSLGDLNNDGKLDVLIGSAASISYAFGVGDGTFGGVVTNSGLGELGVYSVRVADLNRDGQNDLLWSSANTSSVRVRLGTGGGSLGTSFGTNFFIVAPGFDPYGVELGDVNGDGVLDALTSDLGGTQEILLGTGTGNFTVTSGVANGSQNALADVNNDGYLDILGGNVSTLTVRLGNGNGTFGATRSFNSGTSNADFRLDVADFNNDGVKDVLFGFAGGFAQISFGGIDTSRRINTIDDVDLSTTGDARTALEVLNRRLTRISQEIGNIGAVQSRLVTVNNNLRTRTENYEAARSRIIDADVATESSNLVRQQILQQTAVSVLAQANLQPTLALRLLQS